MRPFSLLAAAPFFAFALSVFAAHAGAAVITQDAEGRYQALLAAAKARAPNVDWAELRLAYADRPGFKAFAQTSAKRQMFKAAETGDCVAALPAAKSVIEEAYIDADAHLVAAYCEEAAGAIAAAKLDRDIGAGLIRSIETGDGLSPATAFSVISVDEEYSVARARGLKVGSQTLVQQGGHSYDALRTTDDKGRAATYYFLVDRVLAAESAAITPGVVRPTDRTP